MDNYAMRKLSKLEQEQLEQMVKDDPSLQVELDMRKDISDGVTLVGNRQLRKMLDKIHNEVVGPQAPTVAKWKHWVGIGIATALAALFGYLMLSNTNGDGSPADTQPAVQYASYYTPLESTDRSENASDARDLEQRYLEAYRTGDYVTVISILQPKLTDAGNEQRLVVAIAALETGDLDLASTQLERITVSDDFYYVDHAKWYQALLYIKLGQDGEAQALLTDLAKDKAADHHEDAKKLLKTIK